MDFSTSYSPDGARFAFLRVKGGDQVDLLIADADGSNERVLATRPYFDFFTHGTAWSPDGQNDCLLNCGIEEKHSFDTLGSLGRRWIRPRNLFDTRSDRRSVLASGWKRPIGGNWQHLSTPSRATLVHFFSHGTSKAPDE